MNIKLTGLVLGTALSALAFTGCQNAAVNTNANANVVKVNSNTAVVVNSNTNTTVTTTNTTTTTSNANWNGKITKEEYEKSKGDWSNRAKNEGASIGQGVEDGWLWTKTRASLATTDDLRESTINVDVDNAVVTLKGTVANAAQKAKAETVAKGIEGVKSVKNNLTVSAGDSVTNTSNTNTKK
jgi:hypothetical protein